MNTYIISVFMIAVMTVIVGVLVKKFMHMINPVELDAKCREWNKYHTMEKSLFLTGLIVGALIEA